MKTGTSKSVAFLALMLSTIVLVSCSVTPTKVNRLDLDNHYVSEEDINNGPDRPNDMVLTGNFTVDGGYTATTVHRYEDFPVMTTIIPPNWAVVDVAGPPRGAVGAIGTPRGVGDGRVVPTALFSVVELDVDTLDEAQDLGMEPFRNDPTENWEVTNRGSGEYRSTSYTGDRPGTTMDMKAVTEYVEWRDSIIGFSVVFTRDQSSPQEDWDATQSFVSASIRTRDGEDFDRE